MENMNVQSLGAAAGAVTMVYIMFQNAPKVIEAFKPKVATTEETASAQSAEAFDRLTNAILQLTQFLQTSAAVSEVKELQSTAKLSSIENKLDTVIAAVNEHSTKCDATCRK